MASISLLDCVGTGLIIQHPSGVTYSNQTGGTACLHPEQEGVYVPLRNDISVPENKLLSPETALLDYFEGPKHRGIGATNGLDAEDADFIDGVLRDWRMADFLEVDRGRLRDSHEAWVYVRIKHDEDTGRAFLSLFHGFAPYPKLGVLTWTNSD